jgi:hypothetical protein
MTTANKTRTATVAGKPRSSRKAPAAAKTTPASSRAKSPQTQASAETPAGSARPRPRLTPEEMHRMIAEAAYYRAERRGFAPGGEELDWFEAEAELRAERRAL